MSFGARRLGLLIAIAACGETLPAAERDGGPTAGDAGSDAVGAEDAGTDDAAVRPEFVTTVTEPWRLAVAGSDLVVTSHAATDFGVFRAPKTGGAAVRIGSRPAYGVAVRGADDVWFCNSEDAGGPALVQVPLDGGSNIVRVGEPCRDVVAEPNGDIAFTLANTAQRYTADAGNQIFLSSGEGPDGIAADDAGVYFAEREGNKIGFHRPGDGPGKLVSNIGPGPTRVRADGEYVYWVELGTAKVQRLKRDGIGSIEELAVGPDKTAEGGLAIDGTHVYWVVARGPNAGLYRVPKQGGKIQSIATGLTFPVDVALDETYAYVTVHGANEIVRFAKP